MKRVLFYLAKMADASSSLRAKKIPDNLYDLCLTKLVHFLQKSKYNRHVLRVLPDSTLMDVYSKMLQEKRLCILAAELSKWDTFERLLRFAGSHLQLLQCFQAVIEHGTKLSTEVSNSYLGLCDAAERSPDSLIDLGLRVGGFLNDAGWYADAERVLVRCRDICQSRPQTTYYKRLTLECCHRLLSTQSAYCCFPAAAKTYALSLRLLGLGEDPSEAELRGPLAAAPGVDRAVQTDDDTFTCLERCTLTEAEGFCNVGRTASWGITELVTRLFKEFSALFFVICDYDRAHAWGLRALRLLTPRSPLRITLEACRACGKACVVKRRFREAGLLVRRAAALAPRRSAAAALARLDLAFFLLNVDCIPHSVAGYEEALSQLRAIFGRCSLHVAAAQEDLAYALYVLEYSSGRFYQAREHAERAIRTMQNLVPQDHLLLASAKRVKALILEEIALDTPPGHDLSEPNLLEESESLHKAALALSMSAFGEKNVQTAKHYGNLGRLYQSMQKFQDAESMHLKAIAIKEELLGPDDYEVGLSIGHLASLYNYHMNMHSAAEQLYLRSIGI
ncbi:hypothetical protein ACJJTC_013049, partial [Scirpophaga incertulas]